MNKNDAVLTDYYCKSLDPEILDKCWNSYPTPVTLRDWMRVMQDVDVQKRQLARFKGLRQNTPTQPAKRFFYKKKGTGKSIRNVEVDDCDIEEEEEDEDEEEINYEVDVCLAGTDNKTCFNCAEIRPKAYHQYLHLFSKKASKRYPERRTYNHEIHLLPDFKPTQQSPYSLNPEQMKLAKEFVQENLAKGYIIHSKSAMASPLFFVGKKDRASQPCQDYQKLNEGTIKDAFPLPNIRSAMRSTRSKILHQA
jgi:hypothetical protein